MLRASQDTIWDPEVLWKHKGGGASEWMEEKSDIVKEIIDISRMLYLLERQKHPVPSCTLSCPPRGKSFAEAKGQETDPRSLGRESHCVLTLRNQILSIFWFSGPPAAPWQPEEL